MSVIYYNSISACLRTCLSTQTITLFTIRIIHEYPPLPLSISTDRCTENTLVSEQEQAQHHEHKEEEPDLVQGPLDLHLMPPQPRVHVLCSDMVRARVVQACWQLATEH